MRINEVVICDDEQDYIDRAKKVLQEFADEIGVKVNIITYTEPRDLIKDLETKKIIPALIFMDIDFENTTGIKTVEKINEMFKEGRIIYLTNYLEFATDVYTTEHFYYVKKGELRDRLPSITDKLRKEIESESKYYRTALKNKKFVSIKVKDILFFERQGRYTNIYTKDNVYQTKDKLDEIEKELDSDEFVRCHNSYLVPLAQITEYKRDKVDIVEYDIPISRNYQQEMRDRYMKYLETSIFK